MNSIENLLNITLSAFDVNKTTDSELSAEMKDYYDNYLIKVAVPVLVHDKFGQTRDIPKNGGKRIGFRKYSQLAKALTPLAEAVTPTGKKLSVTEVFANIDQYGDFIEMSDLLELTAIDDNLQEAVRLLGDQAGMTLDTVTREVLNGGTNVQYADGSVSARYMLVGGDSTAANNHYMSSAVAKLASRNIKIGLGKKIKDAYMAIIHPDASYDLTSDPLFIDVKKYTSEVKDILEGEIGKLHGIRYVETTEAKVFHAANLTAAARNLTSAGAISTKTITVDQAITAGEATALVGRSIIIDDGVGLTELAVVASAAAGAAGAATITLVDVPTLVTIDTNTILYPGEAGAEGRDVYSTLVFAMDAYGVTKVTGGGLQTFVKQLGSSGTADPLNQRSTAGWKAIKTAEILVEEYMLRVETASTFEIGAN